MPRRSRSCGELAVDRALAAGPARGGGQVGGAADGHARPVGQQDVELADVVDGLAPRDRVRPARVVGDHPAERAAVVRRGIGPERQAVRARGVAQVVEHDPGLHARRAGLRVDLEHPVEVAREVDDEGLVDRLPADARARPAGQQRHLVLAGDVDGRLDVVEVDRLHHADRDVAVVRPVGRPHRPARGVEPHPPAHDRAQLLGEQGIGGRATHRGHRGPVCSELRPSASPVRRSAM